MPQRLHDQGDVDLLAVRRVIPRIAELSSRIGLRRCWSRHTTETCSRIPPLRSELRKGAKPAVPLADRAIGNLQQWLIGTYPGVSKGQLQVYLDEFVFRHNRRKTPATAFQTLLGLGTRQDKIPKNRSENCVTTDGLSVLIAKRHTSGSSTPATAARHTGNR